MLNWIDFTIRAVRYWKTITTAIITYCDCETPITPITQINKKM